MVVDNLNQFSEAIRHLLPEDLASSAPSEGLATCNRCVMLCANNPDLKLELAFNPSTKCCTYYPNLPNFLVGAALSDSDSENSEGSRRILARIATRVRVFPAGIWRPTKYRLLYKNSDDAFGRANSLMCPYYDQNYGACTIWSSRNAICTSWFCVHEDGYDGQDYWDAVRDYLEFVEQTVMKFVLLEFGWSTNAIEAMINIQHELVDQRDLDNEPLGESDYSELWSDWAGREVAFYKKAYELSRTLNDTDVKELGGVDERYLRQAVNDFQAKLGEETPPVLEFNEQANIRRRADGLYLLGTPGIRSQVVVSGNIFEALPLFDGKRATDDAMVVAKTDYDATVTREFVRLLYRQRVLLDPCEASWERNRRLARNTNASISVESTARDL